MVTVDIRTIWTPTKVGRNDRLRDNCFYDLLSAGLVRWWSSFLFAMVLGALVVSRQTIIDYTVISAIDIRWLTEGAAELLKEGWQPLGGVRHTYERNIHREIGPNDINLPNDFEHFSQAFVKYAPVVGGQ